MISIANQQQDVYINNLLQINKYAGIFMPVAVTIVGLLTKDGFFNRDYYYSDTALYTISILFILLGAWNFYSTKFGTKMLAINLGLYLVLSSAWVVFILGFTNPIVLCWAVMVIIPDIIFGRKGYIISMLAFTVTAMLHIAFNPHVSAQYIFYVFGVVVSVGIVGFVVSWLRSVGDSERLAFHESQQQQALERDRLMTLINAMNDAVVSTDQKGVVRVYNAAALNLLDTNKTLRGQNINDVLHLFDDSGNPASLADVFGKKTRSIRTDLAHTFDDGESIDLYISIAPIRPTYRQAAQHGFIIVLRDITKEKSLEEERDEFISVVSHELRTPIAIAEGDLSNVKFLLERGDSGKTLTGAIDGAHDQIMYLARMINDLSTLSRAERGVADEAEDIDVNDMIQALYTEYLPQAQAKKLALNLDLHGQIGAVKASRLYLEEVLQNFITNAIKYTQEGSVTLAARKVAGNKVEFEVKDTGIGISKTDQKRIYGKFYRSEDYRTRETSGTGLGLYVVQKLASKLNITIELKSRLNHGSAFSFTMPLNKK